MMDMVIEMKIISWNVDGLRSAWGRGAAALLSEREADIYCLQETRVSEPFLPAQLEGYYAYWSICDTKAGYAGTLCLSRAQPLRVWYDLALPGQQPRGRPLDLEGRAITLEFDRLCVVNLYVPNSRDRRGFRARWDARLRWYLRRLSTYKPAIVCGDFNALAGEFDIYPGSAYALDGGSFESVEAERFRALISDGWIDCFRAVHPFTRAYTCWSYRQDMRTSNRGSRLDYFLATAPLREILRDCRTMPTVYGSDHCPISLTLAMDLMPGEAPAVQPARLLLTDDPWFQPVDPTLAAHQQEELAALWEAADWTQIKFRVAVLQEDIATAALARNRAEIERCQQRLTQSLDARMLAVRHACSSTAGPGVDGIQWDTPSKKALAALTLSSEDYVATCSRMVLVETPGGKTRRIHLLTAYDRAMQSLYKLALDPVTETWAERRSFAFRKGRTTSDLVCYVKLAFTNYSQFRADGSAIYDPHPPEWGLVGDVHQCYERILSERLREEAPMDSEVLDEMLKSGYLFSGVLFPRENGVEIGTPLAPPLANFALDGLQKFLLRRMYPGSVCDYPNCCVYRYADDILITARTREDAENHRKLMEEYLAGWGLTLSAQKCKIVNIREGFDFVGRHYEIFNGVVCATPSEASVARFLDSVEDIVRGHKGTQRSLIQSLNAKLTGYATMHKIGEDSTAAFRHIDAHVDGLLMELCQRIRPSMTSEELGEYYWHRRGDGQRVFCLPENHAFALRRISDTVLLEGEPLNLFVNPYLHHGYFDSRARGRTVSAAVGTNRAVWDRQRGRCNTCGLPILRDQERDLIDTDSTDPTGKGRKVYVHRACRARNVELIEADSLPDTRTDTRALLEDVYYRGHPLDCRYLPLHKYFAGITRKMISLRFDELEDILDAPLPAASDSREFWEESGFDAISRTWLEHGYALHRLDLRRRRLSLRRKEGEMRLNIPIELLTAKLPETAIRKLNNCFAEVIKEFNL